MDLPGRNDFGYGSLADFPTPTQLRLLLEEKPSSYVRFHRWANFPLFHFRFKVKSWRFGAWSFSSPYSH
jgi:hypothetical protein